MNARDYKIFRPGNYYHLYNRGNNKEPIFLDSQDFLNFLKRLRLALGQDSVKKNKIRLLPLEIGAFTVLCYCLMLNHFHLLIRQNGDITIDRLISKVCTSYAKYFNKKYERVGHVFQDTFKAKLVDNDSYLTYLSAYIHNNPIQPLLYDYSSLNNYLGLRDDGLCDKSIIMPYFNNNIERYKQFVLGFMEKDQIIIQHLLFEE